MLSKWRNIRFIKKYNYQKSGEYSIMVLTDPDGGHSHFTGAQLAGIDAKGERVPMLNPDGTFPKNIFDVKGSYGDCSDWFWEMAKRLVAEGHSVYTYTEESVKFPRYRMLVNLSSADVAYMEANAMIFLTEENEDENIAGEVLEWNV